LERIQDQQILIARDNRGALTGARRRQHDIVIGIATNRRFKWDGRDECERFLEQASSRSHIRGALMKLSSEDVAQLVQQRSGRNYDVMANAVLQQVAAGAARNERGDEHVCIQQQFHETRVNTSSSVKMPCACVAAIMRWRSFWNRRTKRKSSSDWPSLPI
jgi:hypothetical protein